MEISKNDIAGYWDEDGNKLYCEECAEQHMILEMLKADRILLWENVTDDKMYFCDDCGEQVIA